MTEMRLRLIPGPVADTLSVMYSGLIRLRNWLFRASLFRARTLPCPVISVGNLTVGGTGKTPLIITLARYFGTSGWNVVVLSRGYGRQSAERFIMRTGPDQVLSSDLVSRAGDEPFLIARSVPNITLGIGPDRHKTGSEAIRFLEHPLVLLDDGFQHQQLGRTINLLVIDASRPFVTEKVLPAGHLREPLAEIQRADAVILTRTELTPNHDLECRKYLDRHFPRLPQFTANSRLDRIYCLTDAAVTVSPEQFRHCRIVLVSAVGNPHSVEVLCRELSVEIMEHIVFRDHHLYTEKDFQHILHLCDHYQTAYVFTTEKDAAKLARFSHLIPDDRKIYVLCIAMFIEPASVFAEWIQQKMGAGPEKTLKME